MLLALVVLAAVTLVGRLVAALFGRFLARTRVPVIHRNFFVQLMRWMFVGLGLVAGLSVMGLTGLAASLVASGGFTAIVLGFAFRGIGENFLAGFFLVIGRNFKVGDLIQSGEFQGIVRSIELRQTHIRAADGRDIYIPSIQIFSSPLVNYTRDGLRRFSFELGLDYADDIEQARGLLLDVLGETEQVLEDPAPGVNVKEFGSAYVHVEAFYWIDTFARDVGPINVRNALMDKARRAILEAGFTVSSEVSTNLNVRRVGEDDADHG